MNNSSDKKGRKIASYIIPGIITLLVMVFVLIVKGIWPFGSNRIDLFDNMQQVAPLYAHLWDAMHGNASVWFDWYTGLGTNVSMSISAFSMFSPFNLLYIYVQEIIYWNSYQFLHLLRCLLCQLQCMHFLIEDIRN